MQVFNVYLTGLSLLPSVYQKGFFSHFTHAQVFSLIVISHFFTFSFYSYGHLHPVFRNRHEITPWQFQAMAKRIISNFKFTATNEEGFDRRKVLQTSTNSSIVMKTQKFTEKCASDQCLALAAAQAVLEFCMPRRLSDKLSRGT